MLIIETIKEVRYNLKCPACKTKYKLLPKQVEDYTKCKSCGVEVKLIHKGKEVHTHEQLMDFLR